MQKQLLVLSYIAKAAGFISSLSVIPGVSPSTGVLIFFIASLAKDTINRIGDYLDNGKSDWRS